MGLVVTGASLARVIAPTFAGALMIFPFVPLTGTYGDPCSCTVTLVYGWLVPEAIRVSQLKKESRENEAAVGNGGENTTSERI